MQTNPHRHSHSHAHAHSHARPQTNGAPTPVPDFSLLRLSVPQRLTLALLPVAIMWLLLLWAFVA
jgi:hypothetical protein